MEKGTQKRAEPEMKELIHILMCNGMLEYVYTIRKNEELQLAD